MGASISRDNEPSRWGNKEKEKEEEKETEKETEKERVSLDEPWKKIILQKLEVSEKYRRSRTPGSNSEPNKEQYMREATR
jgi:hypothetical protein